MLTVTKQLDFCYGHHLPGYKGKCCEQHGHNSILEIEIEKPDGWESPPKGMIMDFSILKDTIKEHVIDALDHKNINSLPRVMGKKKADGLAWNQMVDMPTAENMITWISYELQNLFGKDLVRVRLSETPTSWAEWKR